MEVKEAGPVVTLTLAVATVAYRPLVLGAIVVIPQTTKAAGELVSCLVPGCGARAINAPKHGAAGRDWAQGQQLYWDAANNRWTDDSTAANVVTGAVAAAAATAAAATGEVLLLRV